jgi:hypothetical protein
MKTRRSENYSTLGQTSFLAAADGFSPLALNVWAFNSPTDGAASFRDMKVRGSMSKQPDP